MPWSFSTHSTDGRLSNRLADKYYFDDVYVSPHTAQHHKKHRVHQDCLHQHHPHHRRAGAGAGDDAERCQVQGGEQAHQAVLGLDSGLSSSCCSNVTLCESWLLVSKQFWVPRSLFDALYMFLV